MVIVENNEQLDSFLKIYTKEDSILIPIQSDEHKHSVESNICNIDLVNLNFINRLELKDLTLILFCKQRKH